jgi:hypothetical protein
MKRDIAGMKKASKAEAMRKIASKTDANKKMSAAENKMKKKPGGPTDIKTPVTRPRPRPGAPKKTR